ncbi:hypothetical protein WN55_06237 [Dufourea novaeangliae]|uniref:Uncharacterized protein n=1 Tax=Dufourea novaeangliae TaxID=178035 RepID=A0A154PSE3_DUFNO|nr:hypothetical protein WN55_06237 [Dufourea novaeangliae]
MAVSLEELSQIVKLTDKDNFKLWKFSNVTLLYVFTHFANRAYKGMPCTK